MTNGPQADLKKQNMDAEDRYEERKYNPPNPQVRDTFNAVFGPPVQQNPNAISISEDKQHPYKFSVNVGTSLNDCI